MRLPCGTYEEYIAIFASQLTPNLFYIQHKLEKKKSAIDISGKDLLQL